jgi:uncharacterized membrane protein
METFSIHQLNIATHVAAGSLGILLGLYLLATQKATARHRRIGRVFVASAAVVCVTAIVGTIFFRFMPLFAVLSLLVPYLLMSGWHAIYTREAGPNRIDAVLLVIGVIGACALVPILATASRAPGSSSLVAYSTLGALAFVMAYDAARWVFPRRWHATTWRLEHIYKILSSLFGMMSAAIGNIFQTTFAQLAPSAIGLVVGLWFMVRQARALRGARHNT